MNTLLLLLTLAAPHADKTFSIYNTCANLAEDAYNYNGEVYNETWECRQSKDAIGCVRINGKQIETKTYYIVKDDKNHTIASKNGFSFYANKHSHTTRMTGGVRLMDDKGRNAFIYDYMCYGEIIEK
jgi:hypothetical protein